MSLHHPSKDQLIAFGQGKLAADESSSVEQHLEVCRECCETLLDLKDDTFVGLVRIANPDADVADAASVRTDPGGDASGIGHGSEHAVTLLVQLSEPVSVDELPAELQDHPRYRIVDLIGRGGMGNVYRAEHRLMNREVALKLINSQLIRHPQAIERFRREVQAAAKLTHPNIVTAYDAEQAGDVHFLVMEFVEGTDLASVVKYRGAMSVADACDCIRQVAEGLQHAHEKGMVHRDIKPHNLMLSAEGQVRILDFGLAGFVTESVGQAFQPDPNEQLTSQDNSVCERSGQAGKPDLHLTTAGSVMGTPDYIAPEQAKDAHSADIRADIYSLGCTLHFLMTGKPPFEADNVLAKLKAHARETPPALTALRKDVPIELEKVASRMLAKNPAERFQTPAEVVAALLPFTQMATVRQQRMRKLIAAALLGMMTLLAGVLVIVSNRGRLEIHSEVEDVKVSVTKGGEQVEVFDLKTGSQMKWLPSGEYELQVVGKDNDVKLDKAGFTMSRLGKVIVTANWNAAGSGVVRAFSTDDQPITQDGVVMDDGGWKITAAEARTVRLFEVPNPNLDVGPFFFRAKLKTENVTGRAYLEMWNRFPGKGEFFSKGIQNPVSGTTGWAEYEIPFFLKKGEQPDLVKLNVTVEGTGAVWIKDIELRGRVIGHSADNAAPASVDPASLGAVERDVLKAAEAFLAVADEGDFDKLYDLGASLAKKQATREQVVPLYRQIRDTAGKVEKRSLRRVQLIDKFLGLPPGRYAAVQFVSDFEKHKGLWETVMLNVDDDGQWRANTYAATVQPLPLPEPKSGSATKSARPSVPTPPPAIKLGENLVTDPSLEETAIGEKYPQGWGTGNVNPPNSFKHQVVEGGRTGQRGWLIEGNGQFAVIPTNRPPAHPAYRYAATAWVRIESGSAQIKLLYFDGQGQYIGENRGNVSVQQDGWHKLTMVDDLKRFPEARSLSLALTMTGAGKVVFDDLELLAFDASKLPEKFEATYGAASHYADVFDRWIGRWESTTTYAPTAATPEERVIKGETIVRKVLGDRFLLWQWSSDDGQSQYLTLLCFDNNIQAYRIWLFGSGGEVFDRTGQWDAASQTLTLQVKPSSPGVTGMSTDRFVSQDRIESTLLVKGSGGQVTRDMRATWIRKSKTVEDEIALADGPRADVSELAVLQKMIGRWSVRQTIKPCIAFPNGDQATGTEHNAWVLGGRFFLNRAYDDQQRLTSLALQTYDPVEKTYQHWHFAKDVFGGQWRITWDASSRAFHWRSIDMPAGWIGTGFNRWINDDTFDNQALIKDENGRTIFDSHQDKRRKK